MSNESGLSVSKPVAVWNKYKSIKADFKELFKSLGKAAINTALGKWDSVATDIVDASTALGLAETPAEVAYVLIYRALIQAMVSLVEGNKELLTETPNMEEIGVIGNYRLDLSVENMELRIDQEFFRHPKNLPIVEAIKIPFAQWLAGFGVTPAQAETISYRLPTYFVFALHEEWAKHSDKYACLKDELNTPFTKANQREQAWQRYSAWLQKQVEEPMFLEAFSLKQVYVSACAYYKEKVASTKEDELEHRLTEDKQHQRIVVNLESELHTWLNKADRNDAIRIISGGPGSGKSSFTKIFAAQVAEKENIKVLFIPLHQFNPLDDLVDSVGDFINSDIYGIIAPNPLLAENAEQRLLIIFDGLDELAMQGKIAAEVAQQFVREVQRKVDRFNSRETRLQVLISGRELVVQANSSEFRQPKQILYILPYFVTEREKSNYIDTQNLLTEDKRQLWWQKYSKVKGYAYTGLPPELDQGNLTEITAQPLLNYLVALSFVRGEVRFEQDSNLNVIYRDLLKAVYQRGWERYPHPSLQGIEEKDFVRILEEIALASWHGDGRKTTVKEIETHCDNSGLKHLLDIFQEGAKLGVTRLLTAFYFRQSGVKESEKTFEFTHKSFGEYLTAKRIVREVQLIHRKLEARKQDPDEGWDEREALKRWAILCGASTMDEYLFNLVIDEIKLHKISDVGNWQQTLCHLIGFMLRQGMPMELLNPRPNFQEENRQARNAEEALLVVLNACARVSKNLSHIKWPSLEAFGNWIARLQGQRVDYENKLFCLDCLSFLDLENCILISKDFFKVNLEQANLVGVDFCWADLEGANLKGANLEGANLEGANLEDANLEAANLKAANLELANLKAVNLKGRNLEGANLEWADLKGANLKAANLKEANLKGTNLERVNFERANLEEASLERANLEGANFRGTNLRGANLKGTIFEGKVLTLLNQDSASDTNE